MKRSTIVCLIVAASLILAGVLLFTCAIATSGFNFISGFNMKEYETTSHEITEEFDSISIDARTADINVLPATDGKVTVLCFEQENLAHDVSVEDGTLKVKLVDERRWFEHITFFNLHSPTISVYLPEAEYAALAINSNTSDVDVSREFNFAFERDKNHASIIMWSLGNESGVAAIRLRWTSSCAPAMTAA